MTQRCQLLGDGARRPRGDSRALITARTRSPYPLSCTISETTRVSPTVEEARKMAEEHHDLQFENADAGSSHTIPMAAGNIKKNGFIVIKGRACKVIPPAVVRTGVWGSRWPWRTRGGNIAPPAVSVVRNQ